MDSRSEYKLYRKAADFYWKMEPDKWVKLDDVTFQQSSWGAKIDMLPREKEILLEVGKWMIQYGLIDAQRMEMTFRNDYSEVKKTPWDIKYNDSLYRQKKEKDESAKRRKLEENVEGEGDFLTPVADNQAAETEREDERFDPEVSPGD